MTFLTPALAIGGLAAVSIPVIIHLLFRQRRTPVEWAAMRFLLEAFKKFRRRLQMEQLILLLLRCAILGLLGAALARPLFQSTGLTDFGGSRAVYFIIDDGMTSGAVEDDGTAALTRHIAAAIESIDQMPDSDRIGIITASRPARIVLSPPSGDHAAVIRMLRSLEPQPRPTDITAAVELFASVVDEAATTHDQVVAYMLSDFRSGSVQFDTPLGVKVPNPNGRVSLLMSAPASHSIGNVQVESVEPLRRLLLPGQNDGSGQVTVRLARHGGDLPSQVTSVRLSGENIPLVAPRTVTWSPGQTEADVDFILDTNLGAERDIGLTASIDGDRLPADDARHAVLSVRRSVRVVLVERRDFMMASDIEQMSPGQWMRSALEPYEGSPMEFVEVEPAALGPVDLRAANVVVLARPDLISNAAWDALRVFVDRGGLLLITPPAEPRVHQWIDLLGEKLGLDWTITKEVRDHADGLALADEQPRSRLLHMVSSELSDLVSPVYVTRSLAIDESASSGQVVLRYADGSPMLMVGAPDASAEESATAAATSSQASRSSGLVALLSVSPALDWTNLPTKPLIVPLMHELVRQGLSQINASNDALTTAQHLWLPAAADRIVHEDGQSIAVDQDGALERTLTASGLYDVVDRADQPLGSVAVNIDPNSGRTQVNGEAAVLEWLSGSGSWQVDASAEQGEVIADTSGAASVARMVLLAVLVLAGVETLLARWFSHAYQGGAGHVHTGFGSSIDQQRGQSSRFGSADSARAVKGASA